jgi:hypothetical protein
MNAAKYRSLRKAVKKKVEFSQCLNYQALRHEGIWESGVIAPPFLTSAVD